MRHEERCQITDDVGKRHGVGFDALKEGGPLPLLVGIVGKGRRQGVGRFGGDGRIAALEGRRDRTGKTVAFKLMGPRQPHTS